MHISDISDLQLAIMTTDMDVIYSVRSAPLTPVLPLTEGKRQRYYQLPLRRPSQRACTLRGISHALSHTIPPSLWGRIPIRSDKGTSGQRSLNFQSGFQHVYLTVNMCFSYNDTNSPGCCQLGLLIALMISR